MRQSLHIATRIGVLGSQRVKNSPNISDLTQADFFQLNLSQIQGKKW